MNEGIIIIDNNDQMIGTMDKMAVHRLGVLHRAFSVFIFNKQGRFLLQHRALDKYHSAGKWTNTCCSHPRPGEKTIDAANRRLFEEMGMKCKLSELFTFTYRAEMDNGLTEHELDHVFYGISDLQPRPSGMEVADFKYVDLQWLSDDLLQQPHLYTDWLKLCFAEITKTYYQLFP